MSQPIESRASVVVVTKDAAAAAYLQDLLELLLPETERGIEVSTARAALAAVAGPRRRRLVVMDGPPPDLTPGALIEAIRVTDPRIPIVLVRPDRPPSFQREQDGVQVVGGPLERVGVEELLARLIALHACAPLG